LPTPCPRGTFNPVHGSAFFESCQPCRAGKWCNRTGIVDDTHLDCPAGFYCMRGTQDATPCPAGTYSPILGATSVKECLPCPAHYACASGSTLPLACQGGFYCPAGSGDMAVCEGGYYCPFNSSKSIPCPPGILFPWATPFLLLLNLFLIIIGFYCPVQSIFPIACDFGTVTMIYILDMIVKYGLGTYCPGTSSSPIPCPYGTLALKLPAGANYSTKRDACQSCPKGTYGDGVSCSVCPEGFVCLEGCASASPESVEADRGYPCPPVGRPYNFI
jgi:hypothetical protein